MTHTRYTTDDLAPEDRLPHFDHLQVHSQHPMHVLSDEPESFSACARTLDLAAVNVVDLVCSSARVVRTPHLVRDFDPDLVSLVIPRSGRLVVAQCGRQAVLHPDDMALYTSGRPFQIQIESDAGSARLVRMHLPRSLLAAGSPCLDEAVATRLPGHSGVGALLRQFLTQVTSQSEEYGPADLPRLGNLAVDLLAATLAHEFDTTDRITSHRRRMLPQIMGFVREHLHDAQLSPSSIAAAHHISVSYLHRLFQAHDTTVSAWIRRERLDRARRDLSDPRLLDLPIHRIAARWGYTDHATFTRAFRTDFGVPPRDYRQHMLEPETDAGLCPTTPLRAYDIPA